MKLKPTTTKFLISFFTLAFLLPHLTFASSNTPIFLNVSYDPTRELYDDYNELFLKHWIKKTGQKIRIVGSNGGSGKQSRSVIDGLHADVVTLALAYDIDAIAKAGLIDKNWQQRLPHNSCAYNSTIVFLVRKNNPKAIKDWDDLIKGGISVITPNPKTSGGARWNYLAAYDYALKKYDNDKNRALEFMKKLFANVPILDTGARAATTTFVKRGIGDVLITWENEAYLALEKLGQDQFEIVIPSSSILTEPPIAVVDQVVAKKHTKEIAQEYLEFLYSEAAQEIIAKHYFRPVDEKITRKYKQQFPQVKMSRIEDFGGWEAAQKTHFSDGGTFDQIYIAN